jgi:hypothetical protein
MHIPGGEALPVAGGQATVSMPDEHGTRGIQLQECRSVLRRSHACLRHQLGHRSDIVSLVVLGGAFWYVVTLPHGKTVPRNRISLPIWLLSLRSLGAVMEVDLSASTNSLKKSEVRHPGTTSLETFGNLLRGAHQLVPSTCKPLWFHEVLEDTVRADLNRTRTHPLAIDPRRECLVRRIFSKCISMNPPLDYSAFTSHFSCPLRHHPALKVVFLATTSSYA